MFRLKNKLLTHVIHEVAFTPDMLYIYILSRYNTSFYFYCWTVMTLVQVTSLVHGLPQYLSSTPENTRRSPTVGSTLGQHCASVGPVIGVTEAIHFNKLVSNSYELSCSESMAWCDFLEIIWLILCTAGCVISNKINGCHIKCDVEVLYSSNKTVACK